MNYQVGEQGRTLEVAFTDDEGDAIDLSSYTTKQIIYRKPGAAAVTLTAAFVTDGTDGLIDYDVDSTSFFDTAGAWTKQGIVSKTGDVRKTKIEQFHVFGNL
jgi:hypothetical protein